MPLLIPHELHLPAGVNPNDTWLGITSLDRLEGGPCFRAYLYANLSARRDNATTTGLKRAMPHEERVAAVQRILWRRELLRRDEEARVKLVEDDLELVPAAFRQWPSRQELWRPVSCDSCDWTPERYVGLRDADARVAHQTGYAFERAQEAFEAALARWSTCKGLTLWRRPLALWEQATLARDARRKDETV